MFGKVWSMAISGMEVVPVRVEADISDGLPCFTMVGDLNNQVREAQDRVRSALKNVGIILPPKRITINLAPATVHKEGSSFDLAIAAAVLLALGLIPGKFMEKMLVLGEFGLDGSVNGVKGVLASVMAADKCGCDGCICPQDNRKEAELAGNIRVGAVDSLEDFIALCRKGQSLPAGEAEVLVKERYPADFSEVRGQQEARRAALIAAAGFHNLLMVGEPGAGKTMIARCMPGILPPLSRSESLELTEIYSVAGLLDKEQPLIGSRPFRAPHHTLSPQALLGGGRIPHPGEVSLAHKGILFLDEMAEASGRTLEVLRQPLEEKQVIISRVSGNYRFPAGFLFVGAMNGCPCGAYPDMNRCRCTPGEIFRYQKKISQPLLERMELCVVMRRVGYEEIVAEKEMPETSEAMRQKVMEAWERQKYRYREEKFSFNSELPSGMLRKYCGLNCEGEELLAQAFSALQLSARGYHCLLRTARTIADLEGSEEIKAAHIGEAVGFRAADSNFWRL